MSKKTTQTVLKNSVDSKQARSPVVVILGHIDHGKTTLLSKIRQSDLNRKEHGGITQHVAAYQVAVKTGKDKKIAQITFVDTPGHAAFKEMRSRGAKIADLAILVVAASEGVKPQTLESLKYIQSVGLKYMVALNKIDLLPDGNLNQAKLNLAENGIQIEEHGGEVVVVPVSAKDGKGIDELLEMILLLGEMMDLKGDLSNKLEAIVLESKLDTHKGPLATVLVRDGSLKVGDQIKAGGVLGKIKAMFNDKQESVKELSPSQPAEILGFKQVPEVGSMVEMAKEGEVLDLPVADKTEAKVEAKPLAKPEVKNEGKEVVQGDDENKGKGEETEETPTLKIILKADVAGTLEAIESSLPANCQLLKSEVGEINDSDVMLAIGNKAEIVAFNIKVPAMVKKLAQTEKVKISSYKIIYELLEDLDKKALRLISPDIDEEVLGKAEILAEFSMKDKVAGCRMLEGTIDKKFPIHLSRGGKNIASGHLKSLKQGKTDVETIGNGEEFGAVLSGQLDFQVGDVLVSYRKPPAE